MCTCVQMYMYRCICLYSIYVCLHIFHACVCTCIVIATLLDHLSGLGSNLDAHGNHDIFFPMILVSSVILTS